MLEDAGGIRRVVLACGFVDLRKGSTAWPPSSGTGTGRTHLKRERCSSSAGNDWTGAKGCCGWAQGFVLLYKRFENGRLSWPRNSQEAAELTEEQYHYLMMGLNPLDPKIKEVNPWKTG